MNVLSHLHPSIALVDPFISIWIKNILFNVINKLIAQGRADFLVLKKTDRAWGSLAFWESLRWWITMLTVWAVGDGLIYENFHNFASGQIAGWIRTGPKRRLYTFWCFHPGFTLQKACVVPTFLQEACLVPILQPLLKNMLGANILWYQAVLIEHYEFFNLI